MKRFAFLLAVLAAGAVWGAEPLRLENGALGLRFDAATGSLTAVENKLTDEVYAISGDQFAAEAAEFQAEQSRLATASVKIDRDTLAARYQGDAATVEVTWTLRPGQNFAEKRVAVTARRDCRLKKVVVSRPAFTAPGLSVTCYRYPQFGRSPGGEPICTYFGRTAKGGCFTGLEMPFDASSASGTRVMLAYCPSLKVKAGQRLLGEPAYVGVYRRGARDDRPAHPTIRAAHGMPPSRAPEVLPLESESEAMVAMTSAVLGPPRHGLVAMACGWHSEMQHGEYASAAMVDAEMRSVDFLAECGIDWLSDSHPWGGETAKMNALGAGDSYAPGPLVRKSLDHARAAGVKVVMWPSMNNTHHWSGAGRPFRADKPEWLMTPKTLGDKPDIIRRKSTKANCFANTPFFDWLSRINDQGLDTGYYKAWCMDGSFFGDGGWFTSVIPVDCASDAHDHLPGDSNYACQRALDRLIAGVRRRQPDVFIILCRPPMDLGVWSCRNADACFTLLESGTPPSNVAAGDEIRKWSRVRVQHHFFPHYLDQPLLFQSRYVGDKRPFAWSGKKLDYILLSALACSPNQLYYMPTKTGIPDAHKAEIRKWLDWGRRNVEFLKVRKDLPDWPAEGQVDGSAHVVGDRGLVFLFNTGKGVAAGQFELTEASIGLTGKGMFEIVQEHPAGRKITAASGATVRWDVPPETAVVLRLSPDGR